MPLARRTYADAATDLVRRRTVSIAVCVPTVDEAATIGPICATLMALRGAGVIDRVVVADESRDGTAAIAASTGAEVVRQSSLLPAFGPVRGKGDALWRALSIIDEDVVVFVDGDTSDFDPAMVTDLAAAVALDGFTYAKATYRRPFAVGDVVRPTGGGRVTELTAKPLLGTFFPSLRAFSQPLAGEFAARTDALRRLPFATGYSVDVALLIDVYRDQGLTAMVEVDTGVRQNRHRPLEELGPMAVEVMAAILDRAGVASQAPVGLVERPPIDTLFAAARSLVPEAA